MLLKLRWPKVQFLIQKARLEAIKYLSEAQNNLTGKFPKAELLLSIQIKLITDEEEAITSSERFTSK